MKKLLTLSAALCVVLSAHATPINSSGANGEMTLQSILAGTSINVATNQIVSDSYFTGSSVSGQMVIEFAGYAPNNAFGIYQQGSPGTKVQLFGGSAAAGAISSLVAIPVGWSSFGFYLSNPVAGFTWYSDAALNAGGGLDHFVAFAGTAGEVLSLNGMNIGSNDILIGIEDLNLGDYDYNDMVVKVHLNPVPSVPEGGSTLTALALALASLAALRRRLG